MSVVTQIFLKLIAWLAVQAGARLPPPPGAAGLAVPAAVPAVVAAADTVAPDRAGRLVPAPGESLETEAGRSLLAHWALWAAVALIVALLAAGYLRRRWRARAARSPAPHFSRDRSAK